MNPSGVPAKPWVVLVGGFLGAGKTTLFLAAAKKLNRRALRCAMVTNDQGGALVGSGAGCISGVLKGHGFIRAAQTA